MGAYDTIVRFFQSGGMFMYPIMVVLALGLAIAIERYIYLSLATAKNSLAWRQFRPQHHDEIMGL
jgi:hypothetical protein